MKYTDTSNGYGLNITKGNSIAEWIEALIWCSLITAYVLIPEYREVEKLGDSIGL